MLPQVLLVLHGTSTVRTRMGRHVELYHVTLKHKFAAKEANVRYKTLRKYLNKLGALDSPVDELVVPPKHPLHSSSNKAIVDTRVRQFRACFHTLSARVLTDAQIQILHNMMDEANAMIQQYKILAQSSINGSNGRTESSPEVSETNGDDAPNQNNDESPRNKKPLNAALKRPSQLRPYDNAFAALNKARKSNNDSPIDRSIEPLVQRAATSAELSKYFERLADDMLLELHTVTPYRSNSIRLPPLQSKTNRPVDMRLEYTEEDAAYLEQLAMETWSNALNDGEMLDDVPDDDGNALHLDREHERVLEAEEFANARGKTAPMDDEVIHDMAHLYFASYYDDSDGEVDDSHIKQTASKCRAMGKAKGEAASRASMSHVLQGYIGDIYSDDSNAPSTRAGRRPSISMTA